MDRYILYCICKYMDGYSFHDLDNEWMLLGDRTVKILVCVEEVEG